jgi:ribonucleoside-diphosphate reductase alpha chain
MRYGDDASLRFAAAVMRNVCHTAYRTSSMLAREKGYFPFYARDTYLSGAFIQTLPQDIRDGIMGDGIRNSHLTAIAPTGTISLLANNVSSGLEPVFDFEYKRRVLDLDGSYTEYSLTDYAWREWRARHGAGGTLPQEFIDARRIPPETHLDMQAAVQPYVDSAISKTVNIPVDYDFDAFARLYHYAYECGLKGCTTFRPNPVTGAILHAQGEQGAPAMPCCDLEREAD